MRIERGTWLPLIEGGRLESGEAKGSLALEDAVAGRDGSPFLLEEGGSARAASPLEMVELEEDWVLSPSMWNDILLSDTRKCEGRARRRRRKRRKKGKEKGRLRGYDKLSFASCAGAEKRSRGLRSRSIKKESADIHPRVGLARSIHAGICQNAD